MLRFHNVIVSHPVPGGVTATAFNYHRLNNNMVLHVLASVWRYPWVHDLWQPTLLLCDNTL
ncbi:hypothetical protein BCV72DRAFT_127676 [Rhizopus microsporus var. microsporus]|uniref:Uncharacterized protein n=1 Tax=Rhizopus microsporus var. microsporus TaxID=86635 RepID=A0A1X0R2H7_RHIZD|nr:hypothetical protein BCV72DRAFT_127676 [Rhizopus microsporus var. microsporus]